MMADLARTGCQRQSLLALNSLLNLSAGGLATVSALLPAGVVDLAVDLAWSPPGSKERRISTGILHNMASNQHGVGKALLVAGTVDAMVAVARSEPDSPWIYHKFTHKFAAVSCLQQLAMDSENCEGLLLQLFFGGAVRIFVKVASVADEIDVRRNAVLALSAMAQSYLVQLCRPVSQEIQDCEYCLLMMKALFLVSVSDSAKGLTSALATSIAEVVESLLSNLNRDDRRIASQAWAPGFAALTHKVTLAALQAHGSAQSVVRSVLKMATMDSSALREFSTAILSMFAATGQGKSDSEEVGHDSWRTLLLAPGFLPDLVARARTGRATDRLSSLLAVLLLATSSDSAVAALVEAGGRDVLCACDVVLRLWPGASELPPLLGSANTNPPTRTGPGPDSSAAALTNGRGGDSDPESRTWMAYMQDSESRDLVVRAGGLEGLSASILREVKARGCEAAGGGCGGLAMDRIARRVGRRIMEECARGPRANKRVLYGTLDVGYALFAVAGMAGAARRIGLAAIQRLLLSLLLLLGSSDGPGSVEPGAALGPLGLGALELLGHVMRAADTTVVLVALLRLFGRSLGCNVLVNNARACLVEMCRRLRRPLAAAGTLRAGRVLCELHRLLQAHPAPGSTWQTHPRVQYGVRLLSALVDALGDELLGQLPPPCREAGSALRNHLDRLLAARLASRDC